MHRSLEKHVKGEDRTPGSNLIQQKAHKMANVIIDNGLKDISEVWGSEVSLHYPELYAGTTDLVAVYKGDPAICDFKQARKLKKKEIEAHYEKNTGLVIIETLEKLNTIPSDCPGILVNNHGVFTWGKSLKDAIKNAEAIEIIAKMALNSLVINPDINPVNKNLHNKHFYRKHGENKYYGQK